MKIILCSKSNIKDDIIKKWFNDRKNIEIEVKKIDVKNELIPPQPIGNDIKLICLKKINDIKDNYNDVDCIISIENFLDIMEDKIKYRLCLCVYRYDSNEYITKVNEGIDLGLDVMNDYPNFLSIIKDLYIFSGCKDKLCQLVNKYYPEVPKNNFIKFLKDSKYDKFNQISILLDNIF